MAIALLEEVDIQWSNVIADKGYCSKAIRTYIKERGANSVIAPKKPVEAENTIDWHLYKERHLIECFFNKMKQIGVFVLDMTNYPFLFCRLYIWFLFRFY